MRLIDADQIHYRDCGEKDCPTKPKCALCFHGIVTQREIDNMPTIHTERHGWWKHIRFDIELTFDHFEGYQCSECETHWDTKTNYCPFCGVKMDEVSE